MKPNLPTHLSILDRTELHERMMGNADLANRMLGKFLTSAVAECDDLESSIRLGDKSAVVSLAHRHKGTAKTLATHRVAAVADQIEHRAATDSTSDLLDLLEQMRRLHQEVREVVGHPNEDHEPQTGANRI